jgi:hypothetical protein
VRHSTRLLKRPNATLVRARNHSSSSGGGGGGGGGGSGGAAAAAILLNSSVCVFSFGRPWSSSVLFLLLLAAHL